MTSVDKINLTPTVPVPLPTQFAPAERADSHTVNTQSARFATLSPQLRVFLDAVPDIVIVLNAHRQIIFANRNTQTLLGADEMRLLGLRPGEALNCVHASETDGGCGTTTFCSTCGAVRAILTSLRGQADVQECRIIQKDTNEALDLRIWTTPLRIDDQNFSIFAVNDIRHEKRRHALERIFFHDILNTVTAISASAEILQDAPDIPPNKELLQLLGTATEQLTDEIRSQRELLEAENNELVLNLDRVDVPKLLHTLAITYSQHPIAENRSIHIAAPDTMPPFVSDATLLRRVLANMLKNALEASRPGETVTLGSRMEDHHIEFWVNNPGFMPRKVQLQVFQRSFSTKGKGRGLGTYSIKLLGERYLGGRITFETSSEAGTTFHAVFPIEPKAG